MARPAIVAGVSLALMETLADFGTVDYFGVSAFTTGIFRTWYGLGDLQAAAQLAAMLMSFVFILLVAERWSRLRMRFHHTGARARPSRMQLTRARGWLCAVFLGAIIVFGFLLRGVVPVLGFRAASGRDEDQETAESQKEPESDRSFPHPHLLRQ